MKQNDFFYRSIFWNYLPVCAAAPPVEAGWLAATRWSGGMKGTRVKENYIVREKQNKK